MMEMYDLFLVWCFNVMIFGTAFWVILRVVEKGLDIYLKCQKIKEAEQ